MRSRDACQGLPRGSECVEGKVKRLLFHPRLDANRCQLLKKERGVC
jgi:hypothetical protein